MTKLHEFAQRLPETAVLSRKETTSVKGGKRYRTSSKGQYEMVKSAVERTGKRTQTVKHGNEYCLEW